MEVPEAIRELARAYGATEYGTLLIAAAMGPGRWRGCVPVTQYVPSKDKPMRRRFGRRNGSRNEAMSLI